VATSVLVVSTLAGVVLSARVAAGGDIIDRRWGLLVELGIWAGVWVVGVVAAMRIPLRLAVGLAVAAGLALRLAALAGGPVTSDDLYRYAWDGRVQAAGIDPYRYEPTNAALLSLREDWLFPEGVRTIINRPTQPTIYPPAAQAWFRAVYRVAGIDDRHKPWQVAGLVTEIGVLLLLPVVLGRFRRDPRWTALYALCPAPVLEIVNNGHIDGLAILLVVAALAVAGPANDSPADDSPDTADDSPDTAGCKAAGRRRSRAAAAGALLGAAAMVKLFPAVLIVVLVGRRRIRSLMVPAGAAAAVGVLSYLPHVLEVGWKVLGYLPGYLREERYVGGDRFLLASVFGLTGTAAAVMSVVVIGAVVAWVVVRRPPVPDAAVAVMGVLLLATSPVQPWYAVTLLALAAAAAQPRWAAVLLAGYPYFWAIILADERAPDIGAACYSIALAVVLLAGWRSRAAVEGGVRRRRGPPTTGSLDRRA